MLDIANYTNFHISEDFVKKNLTRAIKFLKLQKIDLSVAFVAPTVIKKLNLTYRGQNQATDILSFGYFFEGSQLDGELVICPAVAIKNGKKHGLSLNWELQRLLVHGLLHLVGYDHEKTKEAATMERRENKIIKSIISR